VAVIGIGGDPHAVVTYHTGVAIIDISDPADPDNVGGLDSAFTESHDTKGLLEGAFGVDVFETGGGTYAAVTSTGGHPGVLIINITDPSGPALVGNLTRADAPLLDSPRRVDTFKMGTKTYAAVASGGGNHGIQIIDITNPSGPVAAGQLSDTDDLLLGEASGVDTFKIGGSTYAAVASSGDGGLQLVDVSTPGSPGAAGQLKDTATDNLLLDGTRHVKVFEVGTSTYAVMTSAGEDGIQIVDITDPSGPVAAGQLSDTNDLLLADAGDVATFTIGAYTYAAVASAADQGIQIIDVTDPASPAPAGQLRDDGSLLLDAPTSVEILETGGDTYAVVTSISGVQGIQIVRLTPLDATRPEVTYASLNERTGVLTVTFDEAIDVSETDLSRLYVSDDGAANQIGLAGAAFDHAAADSDTISVTLDDDQRLNAIRLGSPQLDVAAGAVYDLAGNAAADAADVPIPVLPDLVVTGQLADDGELLLSGARHSDIFTIGNKTYAAVAAHADNGLQLVDISDPARLVPVGSTVDTEGAAAFLLEGAYGVATFTIGANTYAATSSLDDDGIQIINVTDPGSPTTAGILRSTELVIADPSGVDTIAIDGKTYAAAGSLYDQSTGGLRLVDVSDPSAPEAAGQLKDNNERLLLVVRDVAFFKIGEKTYAAVASNGDNGLQLVDVSNPDRLKAAGKLADTEQLSLARPLDVDIFVIDTSTYAAVTTHNEGLQLVDVTNPDNPVPAGSLANTDGLLGDSNGVDVLEIDGRTYAAVTSENDHGLRLVDVTDPANPVHVQSLAHADEQLGGHAYDVDFVDIGGTDYAAVTYTDGLRLVRVDVTRPSIEYATLSEHTGVLTLRFDQAVDASETDPSRLYIRGDDGTSRIPLAGASIGRAAADSDTISVTLDDLQRLLVIRLDFPQLDIAAGAVYDLAGNAMDPVADAPVAIIVSPARVGDLAEDSPSRLLAGALDVATFRIGNDTYAAVASNADDGLQLVNITNPTSPELAGSVHDTEGPDGLLLDGANAVDVFTVGSSTYAAVASRFDDGLQLVDVTDPSDPDPAGGLRNAAGLLLGRA